MADFEIIHQIVQLLEKEEVLTPAELEKLEGLIRKLPKKDLDTLFRSGDDKYLKTLLIVAARRNNVPAVKLLLAEGATVNLKPRSETIEFKGMTALAWAAKEEQFDTLDALLQNSPKSGWNIKELTVALKHAAQSNRVQVVDLLLNRIRMLIDDKNKQVDDKNKQEFLKELKLIKDKFPSKIAKESSDRNAVRILLSSFYRKQTGLYGKPLLPLNVFRNRPRPAADVGDGNSVGSQSTQSLIAEAEHANNKIFRHTH